MGQGGLSKLALSKNLLVQDFFVRNYIVGKPKLATNWFLDKYNFRPSKDSLTKIEPTKILDLFPAS